MGASSDKLVVLFILHFLAFQLPRSFAFSTTSAAALPPPARTSVSASNTRSTAAFHRRPLSPLAPLASSSSAQANGDFADNANQGDADENNSRPKTGWNHNLPSNESDFWVRGGASSVSPAASISGNKSPPSANEGDDEPRTGWLHNTKSKAQEQKQKDCPGAGKSSATGSSTGQSAARTTLRMEMEKRARNHRIIAPPAFHPVGDNRIVVTEHKISVPLKPTIVGSRADAQNTDTIDVFFTVVELIENAEDEAFFAQDLGSGGSTKTGLLLQSERADLYVNWAKMADAETMVLYLQGGPGFGAPAPISGIGLGDKGSWAAEAMSKGYKRVVLMDQRGTGRSTPITKQTLELRFPNLFALDDTVFKMEGDMDYAVGTGAGFPTIAEQLDGWESINSELKAQVKVGIGQAAAYMACFRADNIVNDAEAVKTALLMPVEDVNSAPPRPWGAALGQSFGGFCMMTYLSQQTHPPRICLLTGGIAPMLTPAYDAYQRLWERVKQRNMRYYDRYPGDVKLVKRIVASLLDRPATLPSGGRLTARRFLQLGLGLGGSPSAFASLHNLLASAFVEGGVEEEEFSRGFLKAVDTQQSFDEHPIYFLMHESIYADGPKSSPTEWAAHRAYEDRTKTPSEFRYDLTSAMDSDHNPTLFFGEMVFPWMAEGDYHDLSGFGMRALAESLAKKDDWDEIYDGECIRRALAPGGVSKAAAAVYYDDMYVDFDCAMMVAGRGGPLENCKVWVTNDYQHSGLRDDGATIFSKLLGMAKGSVNTPS